MGASASGAAIAVIFDMDGVLVDSYAAHYESWRQTCERHGVPLPEAVFAKGFGKTSVDFLRELWPRPIDESACRAIEHEKELAYRRRLDEHFPEVPGARELVLDLARDGFALAVGSSGPPENVAMVLDALRVRECFGAVVTGRDVTRGKP
ncbi:MAG: HAD family hydrolase, partial [Planctomycetota bacterium]